MSPSPNLPLPIDANDDFLREAVAQSEILPLLVAIATHTGDRRVLDEAVRPNAANMLVPDLGYTAEDFAQSRQAAVDALIRYRDAGCPAVDPPDDETIDALIEWLTGGQDVRSQLQMFREELDLRDEDLRAPGWRKADVAPDWPETYSRQDVLLDYFRSVAEDFSVRGSNHLTVFQRTPNWHAPAPSIADEIGGGTRWLFERVPSFVDWYREGHARLPAHRQAHRVRRRHLGRDPHEGRRGPRDGRHRGHQPHGDPHQRRCRTRGRRADLRHRLPGGRFPDADEGRRPRRRRPARTLGWRRPRPSRPHRAGLPEPFLPLRAQHEHRHQRQHHLLLRGRGALPAAGRPVPPGRGRGGHRLPARGPRRVQRADRRREPGHGVGSVRRALVVQEPVRSRGAELAVLVVEYWEQTRDIDPGDYELIR